ncbi:MAG: homoaconitase [candidate division Zixibacteria bacterium]|nr:homoaconitase [candidate division Zixibacteria bacterium]
MRPQNLIEKIAQRFAVGLDQGHPVQTGDYLSIRPAYCMTHDNTGAVIPKFESIGATRIADPRQLVFALDHNVQDTSEENLKKYAKIEAFAKEHGIDFYPAGRGIGHQIICEEGYAWPGTLVVASDSHSNMYGGLGCLGTPIVRTDAASIWATRRTWWQVPPVAKVELIGQLPVGVTGKDVIITLCGLYHNDEVLNHALEFTGDGLAYLSVEQRLTIANMTTEWGALAGVFPIDEVTYDYLNKRVEYVAKRGPAGVVSDEDGDGAHPRLNAPRIAALRRDHTKADPGAFYAKELTLDLSMVQPFVAGPNTVKVITAVSDIRKKNVKINKAYLVSCVNSRTEDISEAAAMVRGKKVAEGVEFYISAASSEVQAEAEKRGDWQALIKAGAIPLPSGCGPCIGLGKGILQDNEVGISATNRNFKGRMGSSSAQAYLASPAVVAASAIAGKIDFPGDYRSKFPKGQIRSARRAAAGTSEVQIIEGFQETIEGELIFCHQDNLNTDGIFPGKYTYMDDFTPEQQASVVMENYDPEFGKMVEKGDILVGGFNFGTGSSREQAATALKYRGLSLVLAGSFSETFKRNALNNGYLVIEAPELIDDLKERLGTKSLTVRTGIEAMVDFRHSVVQADGKRYRISPMGGAAQELVIAGGLENWVRAKLER